MKKQEVCARIEQIGIIPAVRVSSAADALFAAETISAAGIPIVEITMTIPGEAKVIAELLREVPDLIVGAEVVLDVAAAAQCLDVGAMFLTSPVLDLKMVEFAAKHDVVVVPGVLTPTEVITAWQAGSDLVKVFPCSHVGGESYIRALKGPFPRIPMVAAGGVNQQTAANYIMAGASALGVGGALIPREAIRLRQAHRIRELARRFLGFVEKARTEKAQATGKFVTQG